MTFPAPSGSPRRWSPGWATLLLTALLTAAVAPASPMPHRPRILGVAQASFYVTDSVRAQSFYTDFLGFSSPFSHTRRDSGESLAVIKINDRQSVELRPGAGVSPSVDRLHHVSFEVEDAGAMRAYLQAHGIAASSPTLEDIGGNRAFSITDPNGHRLEFIEFTPDGMTRRNDGNNLPSSRIAARLSHAGILVGQLAASLRFYGEILGFVETWRGGAGPLLSWVNLRVPDGQDYVEFMLYDKPPTRESLLGKHHICLEVPSVPAAAEILRTRPLPAGVRRPDAMKVGVNGKRQINCYDPDGTRVEIMEPTTVDGRPVPPSKAPPPPPLPPYAPKTE